MIELASDRLELKLDPEHGAEVRDLLHKPTGHHLLGVPPFTAAAPRGGDLDEETWTASYRGGWQIAAPNAGNACVVDGEHHGFHGRASVDPWELLDHGADHAHLSWRGHGIELVRRVALEDASVNVELRWRSLAEPAPLVAVEHICFGQALLDPVCEVSIDACAYELSERDGPTSVPTDCPRWPQVLLQNGAVERGSPWPLGRDRGRFISLAPSALEHASARISNAHSGLAIELSWETRSLPAAWLWHEVRASGGPWGHRAELLAFEPAAVPHSLGLARAISEGQALWARPGVSESYRLRLAVSFRDGSLAETS